MRRCSSAVLVLTWCSAVFGKPEFKGGSIASVHCALDELLASVAGFPEPPTLVLAGHHNDGKSALCEALLGVRLAHLGASMSTRRPLRVHAQNDADCEEPEIYLLRDDAAAEERVDAATVRQYVESENIRLARTGEVEDAEIRVRLRWRHAPTVVLIDTPGLLSLATQSTVADAALARASEAAERILCSQLATPTRICVCLEDTADWQLSPTCTVVRRIDPDLSRTVLVATKLDGKLAQFSMAEDLHRLLNASSVQAAFPRLLAGPIFTSIPPTREASPQALAEAVRRQEAAMRAVLLDRVGTNECAIVACANVAHMHRSLARMSR